MKVKEFASGSLQPHGDIIDWLCHVSDILASQEVNSSTFSDIGKLPNIADTVLVGNIDLANTNTIV